MIAMPRLQVEAITTTMLAGCGAEDGGGDAEGAEIDRLGDDRVLAFGRRLERQHFHLVAGGHELIVEIGCDRMNQFQRAGADHDRPLRPHDRRGCDQTGSQPRNELTSANCFFHRHWLLCCMQRMQQTCRGAAFARCAGHVCAGNATA
jgi:hypothetical protein